MYPYMIIFSMYSSWISSCKFGFFLSRKQYEKVAYSFCLCSSKFSLTPSSSFFLLPVLNIFEEKNLDKIFIYKFVGLNKFKLILRMYLRVYNSCCKSRKWLNQCYSKNLNSQKCHVIFWITRCWILIIYAKTQNPIFIFNLKKLRKNVFKIMWFRLKKKKQSKMKLTLRKNAT